MMALKKKDSEELMETYQQASHVEATMAFEELYNRYKERMYAYSISKLQNRIDAEDVLQKALLKVHESKHLYNCKFKFE